MAVIVVFLKDHLIFQVLLKDFSIIAGAIIAGYIQYDSPSRRISELINETIVMCVLYCMICFSPFVPNIGARQIVGYACCLLVSIHLTLNLFLILTSSVLGLKVKLRLWLARFRLKRQRAQNAIKIKSRKRTLKNAILNY